MEINFLHIFHFSEKVHFSEKRTTFPNNFLTMASLDPISHALSTVQIDAKLEDLDRQQAVVEEQLRTVLGDSTNQQK
jgi:hypothetical protein